MLGALLLTALMPEADLKRVDTCRPDLPSVAQVRAVAAGIIEADNARALERVLGYYARDAILLPPNEAAVVGREGIRPRYETLFTQFTPAIEGRIEEACASGRLGFARGRTSGTLSPRGGGGPRILDDVYLMLFRLDDDGVWRISHLMWHPAGPSLGRK